jgi:DNA (cytosine-5)-methyltransferase 1
MSYVAYEFFAGGGMARCGLGSHWRICFANDIDEKKACSYRANHDATISVCDVASLRTSDLPDRADLVWASFPCQDLSLAGKGAGLAGNRSGSFWPFWELIKGTARENRGPRMIVLENVCGLLTSKSGKDFSALVSALSSEGFKVGASVINASSFLPQSRPRLFIVAIAGDHVLPDNCIGAYPDEKWVNAALDMAVSRLDAGARANWFWPTLPEPSHGIRSMAEIVEADPVSVGWDAAVQTQRYLSLMSPLNRAKVDTAAKTRSRMIGTMYCRTRRDAEGKREQRYEVRFDGIAGCLRTPGGGSSRQRLLFVENGFIRSRLLSTREAARLMGLPDSYVLPNNYNEAYHLLGDGVAVPVVRHLAQFLIEPVLQANRDVQEAA